jgi:hypothetical protein
MKTFAQSVLVVLSLSVGACAAGTETASTMRSPSASGVTASSSGGVSRRELAAATADVDREPAGMIRSERGIPTPQPARDPSFYAGPVPQPPLPSPDVHRSSHAAARDAY